MKVLIFISIVFLLVSCKKQESPIPPTTNSEHFILLNSPMKYFREEFKVNQIDVNKWTKQTAKDVVKYCDYDTSIYYKKELRGLFEDSLSDSKYYDGISKLVQLRYKLIEKLVADKDLQKLNVLIIRERHGDRGAGQSNFFSVYSIGYAKMFEYSDEFADFNIYDLRDKDKGVFWGGFYKGPEVQFVFGVDISTNIFFSGDSLFYETFEAEIW